MRPTVRFVAALIAGLGLLAVFGYFGLMRTLRGWYHTDLTIRSRLAVEAASGTLARSWTQKPARLRETLDDIAHDERIAAAAACSTDGKMLESTALYPAELSCPLLLDRLRSRDTSGPAPWWVIADLTSGSLQVGVSPLRVGERTLGVVALVPDLGDLAPREAAARNMILLAFLILAAASSIVTLLAARIAWRGWTVELRRALSGDPQRQFLPLLRDVKAMADRIASEIEPDADAGPWNPERLRSTLTRHLHGERVVVLANREPYIHEAIEGGTRVLHPASGLVTALEPVMRACKGVWVAHGSGTADRATVDEASHVRVPPGEESYVVRRVWLSEEEENGYYYGFSNEGLWPLCHIAHARPVFRSTDWDHYVKVNQRFADAVCEEVDSDDPIVLVQDYHFALAPTLIRQRLPKATILTFWHVPWPSAERVGICPWREEILSGLLGSSIVGFHTQQYCNNFLESVDTYLESRIDREWNAVVQGARRTMVRPYPISIEWPVHWLAQLPPVSECRAIVRRDLGLAPDALVGVGVDRLDYTKG
ncbi:MAG: alpha,alpha-trehalose-phosphate synthase (UDP-forming), partial [Polyangiaceae bacterium]